MRNIMLAFVMISALIGMGAPQSQAFENRFKDCFALEGKQSCPAGTLEAQKGFCCPNYHFTPKK